MGQVANKILIVEGDPETCKELERAFSHGGFQAFTAANRDSAMFQLALTRPDVVILDLVPGTGGHEALSRIRELSSVPVIALTALDDTDAIIGSLNNGADHTMVKPLNVQELQARVRALIRRDRRVAC